MGTRSGLPLCGVLAITDKNWEETRVLLGVVARINIRRNGSSKGEAKLKGVFYTQHQELLRPWLCCGCSTPSWGSLERLSWQRAVWSRIFQNAFLKHSIAVLALGCVSPCWWAALMPPKCLLHTQWLERHTEDWERDQE